MTQLPFRSAVSDGFQEENELIDNRPDVQEPVAQTIDVPAISVPTIPEGTVPTSELSEETLPEVNDVPSEVLATPNYRPVPYHIDTSPVPFPGQRVTAQPDLPEIELLQQGAVPELAISERLSDSLQGLQRTAISSPRHYLPSETPSVPDYDFVDQYLDTHREQLRSGLAPDGVSHPLDAPPEIIDTPTRGGTLTAPLRNVTEGLGRTSALDVARRASSGIVGTALQNIPGGSALRSLQLLEEEDNNQVGRIGRAARQIEDDIVTLINAGIEGGFNAPRIRLQRLQERATEVGARRAAVEVLREGLVASRQAQSLNPFNPAPGFVEDRLLNVIPDSARTGPIAEVAELVDAIRLSLPGSNVTQEDIDGLNSRNSDSFAAQLLESSPAIRDLLTSMTPVETSPGSRQYEFSPSRGRFGEYGTGTFGGLLYLANAIESTVGGALTDIYDAGSFVFGRRGQSSYRIDTLEALTNARDYGFTNYYDPSDRPLGLLDSPVLNFLRVPETSQWGIALAGDVAMGGWSDLLTDSIFRGGRAGLSAARQGNSFGTVVQEGSRAFRGVPELSTSGGLNTVARQLSEPTGVDGLLPEAVDQAQRQLTQPTVPLLPAPSGGRVAFNIDGNTTSIPLLPSGSGRQFAATSSALELTSDGTIRIWNPDALGLTTTRVIAPQYVTPAMTPGQLEWASRNAPEIIEPADYARVYRTNDELTALAKIHELIPADAPVLNNRQLAALRRQYPNLLGRHGRLIPADDLSAPDRILLFQSADTLSGIPAEGRLINLPEFTTTGQLWTPTNPPSLGRVRRLTQQYSDTAARLQSSIDPTETTRLANRLNRLDQQIANAAASVDDNTNIVLRTESFPSSERPVLLDQYGRPLTQAYDDMLDEAREAAWFQQQIARVEELTRDQADVVLENAENVRSTDVDSLATREQYGLEVPNRVDPGANTINAENLELDRLIRASREEPIPAATIIDDVEVPSVSEVSPISSADDLADIRRNLVTEYAASEGVPFEAMDRLVPNPLPPGTVTIYDDAVSEAQKAYMQQIGQPYILPIEASRVELEELFPDRQTALDAARRAGYEGTEDEILARYASSPSNRDPALVQETNTFPVHFTDEVVEEAPTERTIAGRRVTDGPAVSDFNGQQITWVSPNQGSDTLVEVSVEEVYDDFIRNGPPDSNYLMPGRLAQAREFLPRQVAAGEPIRAVHLAYSTPEDAARYGTDVGFDVVDGRHRLAVLQEMGVPTMWAYVPDITDASRVDTVEAAARVSEPVNTIRNIPDNLTESQNRLLTEYTARQANPVGDPEVTNTVRRRLQNADVGQGVTESRLYQEVLPDLPRAEVDVSLRNLVDGGDLSIENLEAEQLFRLADEVVPRRRTVSNTIPSKLGINRSLRESAWYHGTKVQTPDFQAADFALGASLTNELGPGLYLTTDPILAKNYAQATLADDIGQVGSRRVSETGSVIEFQYNHTRGFLNADRVIPNKDYSRSLADLAIDTFENVGVADRQLTLLRNRVRRYLRNHEPSKWAHYLIAQARKEGLTNDETRRVVNSVFNSLRNDYNGLYHLNRNGHYTMSLLNPRVIDEIQRTEIGTGAVSESLVSRVRVDALAHEEYRTAITKAHIEQSQFRLTDYHRVQLTEAGRLQDIRATESAREFGEQQRNVNRSNRQQRARRLEELERNADTSARRQARHTDIDPDPCI